MTQINAAKIAGGSFWMLVGVTLARFSQLISQIVLARLLSPEEFGVWAMVLILTQLSQLFSEGAVGQVLVQRGLNDKKLVDTVYSLGVNVSVGLFVLQALAGLPLAKFFGVPVLWPLAACSGLVFLINAGAGSHSSVLMRQMKFREIAICSGTAGLVRLSGVFTCAMLGGGIWSFVVGNILAAISNSFLVRSLSGYHFTYHLILDWSDVRKVYRFIGGILSINLGVHANTSADNLVLGKIFGAQTLGYYNMAYQLAMLPQYILSRLNQLNFSVLSQQDSEDKSIYVSRALEICALMSALIYGVAFVVAPWLIPMVYGPQWLRAASLFQIILIYAYARGFMSILGTFLNASNKPGVNAAINWALVAISVPSYILGARLGGATGVAIAVALVMGLGATAWFWLVVCRTSGWKIGTLIKPVLLPTFTICITVAAVLKIPFPIDLQAYLQPLAVVTGYSLSLTMFSGGRIPRMVMDVVKQSSRRSV